MALVVPDSFAIPILILFLSGVVTFAAWLVKSNQASLTTAREAASAASAAAARLEELYGRVDELEKWRLRRAEDNLANQHDQRMEQYRQRDRDRGDR